MTGPFSSAPVERQTDPAVDVTTTATTPSSSTAAMAAASSGTDPLVAGSDELARNNRRTGTGNAAPTGHGPTTASTSPAPEPQSPVVGPTVAQAPPGDGGPNDLSNSASQTIVLDSGGHAPAQDADSTRSAKRDRSAESDEIAAMRAAVAANPGDVDALFRLAVQLNRGGALDEARQTLHRLAATYDERGQLAQAARIRTMLGVSIDERAPTADSATSRPAGTDSPGDAGATSWPTAVLPPAQPITARLRQTGRMALGLTLPLRETGLLGIERVTDQTVTAAPFPPEALEYTIPLPDEADLSDELRSVVEESAANLRAGHVQAALDACLYGLALDATYLPLSVRIAEIYTVQRQLRRARIHAETLLRLFEARQLDGYRWMGYRILLHTADRDLASLRRLVELLIDSGQVERASYYASRLIRMLDGEALSDEARSFSARLCDLIPGDTRAALENAVLRLKGNDPGGAVERWETAVAAGADSTAARASLAAVMTVLNPPDQWRLLAEVIPALREDRNPDVIDAYARTADAMAPSPALIAGRGLLAAAMDDPAGTDLLARAASDRHAPAMARAACALSLVTLAGGSGPNVERIAATRTALELLNEPEVRDFSAWENLIGETPKFETLSLLLAEALLEAHDHAGAVAVLEEAHRRDPRHHQLCERLADAYFRSGQLANALTVLDGLAAQYRANAQLEAMATILRQMSRLAPNNIKVKSRLIETYLQRGFVEEARSELMLRAELEERSGLINDAVLSLRRAADLAWTIGRHDETFALYSRILALAPDAVDHRHALVALFLQDGRVAKAAEHQRAIVDISVRDGRVHEAVAALHQVIGLTPDDTSAYFQLGELLVSAGEYRQAERVYRRILTVNPDDEIALAKANAVGAMAEERDQPAASPAG